MKLVDLVRRLRRSLTPPGNRPPLDSSYRQPNITGTNAPSAVGMRVKEGPPS